MALHPVKRDAILQAFDASAGADAMTAVSVLDIATVKPPSLTSVMSTEAAVRPWFIEQIMPSGAFLITGRPKVGKSWLLFQLALCCAGGGPFLDYTTLGQHGVLYVAAEDDVARIQSRFQKYDAGAPPDKLQFILRDELDALARKFSKQFRFSEFLDHWLEANPHITAVILDTESTIRAIWDADRQDPEKSVTRKDYTEVREFDQIAIRRGVFIGLVNHTGKRKGRDWIDIHELINRTNTAMAGASGSWVIADEPGANPNDPEQKTRVLGIRGRDISEEILIVIKQDEFAKFENLGSFTAHQQTAAEEALLEGLEQLHDQDEGSEPLWKTAKDIAIHLGLKSGAVQRCISRMMKNNRNRWGSYRVETKKGFGIRLTGGKR